MQKNDKDGKKTKLDTYNSDNNFINTNNIHEPKKYSRRDFLKLLGMGTGSNYWRFIK